MKLAPWVGLLMMAPIIVAAEEPTPVLVGSPSDVVGEIAGTTSTEEPLPVTPIEAAGASGAPLPQAVATPSSGWLSNRITFDFPNGTSITNQYMSEGVLFGGSGPQINTAGGLSLQPELSGTPLTQGDIEFTFVEPGTSTPAPTQFLAFQVGPVDAAGTISVDFLDSLGGIKTTLVLNSLGNRIVWATSDDLIGYHGIRVSADPSEPGGFGIDDLYFSKPGLDDLDRELGEVDCGQGNPVNPASGNKYQIETDYQGLGPFPLTVQRTYNSSPGSWQFFRELYFPSNDEARLVRPDGKILTFGRKLGSGNWFDVGWDINGEFYTLAGNQWQHNTLQDEREVYDSAGRISSVTNRGGILSHSYAYTPTSITVTHSLGGQIVYSVGANGEITGFTDPQGKQYTYSHSGDLLTHVNYPDSGGSRIYRYGEGGVDADLLTGITDANGDSFATWDYDNQRRAILSEHYGGADRTTFNYTVVGAVFPTFTKSETEVTNALDKKTTYHYLHANGIRKPYFVEGHASPNCVAANQNYVYYNDGFLFSRTDWKGNLTTYVRDSKGQETQRTEASGTQDEERVIDTEWHAFWNIPLKITEPGRETTFVYDGDGNLTDKIIVDTAP